MLKYCVYLTIYTGKKLPPFYIGSSNVDKIINHGYHGSVKSKKYKEIWVDELTINPTAFKTTIISYHETRKEATIKECSLQKALNVVKSPMYINMAFANKEFNSGNTCHKERVKKMSKTYSFIDPQGNEFNGFNIRKFCRDNGLHPYAMRMVANGTYDNHKGWISTDENIRQVSIKKREILSKSRSITTAKRNKLCASDFSFICPNGVVYTGNNISEFAEEHNLHKGHMIDVNNGKAQSHKGWKRCH